MSDNLLVGSKTRAALKAQGVNVGGDALDALNMVVHWYIDQAAKRAAANRRKTVRAHDFIIIEAEAAAAEAPAPVESYDAAPASAETDDAGGADDAGGEAAADETPAW